MDFKDALIKRGYIFHSYEFENIQHGKFFVIIGEDKKNYLLLWWHRVIPFCPPRITSNNTFYTKP